MVAALRIWALITTSSMGVGCSAGTGDSNDAPLMDDSAPAPADRDPADPPGDFRFPEVHGILMVKCAGAECHSELNMPRPAFAQPDETPAYAETMGIASTMVSLVLSGNMPAGAGCAMGGALVEPPPAACLTRDQVATLEGWVDQGALE
jgi:hypothetical protein